MYTSPFSTRYGSPEMRALWSDEYRRRLWRRIWVALAESQQAAGLVSAEQAADLRARAESINIPRALEIEEEIGHDVMAEVKTFAEQCPVGGGIIHWGATSADITDNADVLRQREAFTLTADRLAKLLLAFAGRIEQTRDLPCMAYTHLQPAEPTTFGYRLAVYAQDLLTHHNALIGLRDNLRGKGLKGAVGTQASYADILDGTPLSPNELESKVMSSLGLAAHTIAAQTYPRAQDFSVLSALAGLAASLHKFAFDLRVLQSVGFGEAAEPFGEKQVGSSAMPFKRNPVNTEKICSLARFIASLPQVAWGNAAESLLERTLDDSANRRAILPEAFIAMDEILITAKRIVEGLRIDEAACARNLEKHGPFAATERVLMAAVKAGGDRQRLHERLREHSLKAWEAVRADKPNPLAALIAADQHFLRYLQPQKLKALMDARDYVGTARERAGLMAKQIRERVK
ncbi:MAG: adenylosuccinate lyase [Chloroflexi bacterium]|nr:adenylosuccinate lyase [Chloroflexota bacterium]